MRHKHRNVALASVLALLALAVSASAANATILYQWKMGGFTVGAGESYPATLKNKPGEVFHLELSFGGASVPIASTKLTFTGGSIVGGKPGKLKGRLTFENLTVEKPANCEVQTGKIETRPLIAEIVQNSEAKKGRGKVELVFAPEANPAETWASVKLQDVSPTRECIFKNYTPFGIKGTLLAETSPQLSEAKTVQLLFGTESAKNFGEYVNSAGEFKVAEISNPYYWSFRGEPELTLVNGEKFGAF